MHQSTEIIDGKCSETKVAGGATVGIELLGENLLFSVSFTHRNLSNLPNKQECLILSLVDPLVETLLTSKALIHENHLFFLKPIIRKSTTIWPTILTKLKLKIIEIMSPFFNRMPCLFLTNYKNFLLTFFTVPFLLFSFFLLLQYFPNKNVSCTNTSPSYIFC